MKKSLIGLGAVLSSVVILASETVKSDSVSVEQAREREKALDAAAYINHLNYLYHVMQTYNDQRVLRKEYDRISLRELNMPIIPEIDGDEGQTVLDTLLKTADSLEGLCLKEEEYKEELRRIENEKRKAMKKMVREMCDPENLANAAKGAAKGAKYAAKVSKNPYVAIAGAGTGAIAGGCGPVVGYADRIDNLRFEEETAKIELDKSKRETLVNQNRELMRAENKIIHRLGIRSEDILTEKQLEGLLQTFKKQSDPKDLCRVLGSRSSQANFGCYAPYWSFLAVLCVSTDDPNYELAIKAAESYERVHRDIQKNDAMTFGVMIAKVTAMVQLQSKDKTEIDRCLRKIDKLNERHVNADWSYFCARVLTDYLGENQRAVNVLLENIASLNIAYNCELVQYRNLYKKHSVLMEKDKMPFDAKLLRARVLLQKILKNVKSEDLNKELCNFCRSLTTSTIEKLYYVGDVRVADLWEIAKKDVLGISLNYAKHLIGNEIEVDVPIQWFILGEVESRIELVKGGRVTKALEEIVSDREVMRSETGSTGTDVVRLHFRCWLKDIKGADAVRLVFPHVSWPIEILYQPGYGLDMQKVASERMFQFTPVRIIFMGEKKTLKSPEENMKDKILKNGMKHYTAKLIEYKVGSIAYNANFLSTISIDSNKLFAVAYTNPTPESTCIDLDVRYYNRFGAQLCRVEKEEQKIRPFMGGVWQLEYPADLRGGDDPAYVLFQYHIEPTMWAKYVTNPLARRSVEKQAEEALRREREAEKGIEGEKLK